MKEGTSKILKEEMETNIRNNNYGANYKWAS